jgi:hypothetical protein
MNNQATNVEFEGRDSIPAAPTVHSPRSVDFAFGYASLANVGRLVAPGGADERRSHHKFKVDRLVDFRPKAASKLSAPRGVYKITKLLPSRDVELQYRIKNAAEDHERVADESELGLL